MDLDKITEIMEQFEESDIRELQIDDGQFHLYLSKNKLAAASAVKQEKAEHDDRVAIEKETKAETAPAQESLAAIKSPLVGVVYLQAKPGQPAFVKVGDHVEKGQTVCIIEAMKMMTEVKSSLSGTVSEINVENEDLVEVDQPLISIKED